MQSSLLNILSIGSFKFMNGYTFALNAISTLMDKGILFNYTIIGGRPSEEVLFTIHDLNLGSCVTILDKMDPNAFKGHLYNTDVLLVPYLQSENIELAVSSMSTGVIVVATDSCGVKDIIKNGENGFLVPMMDSRSIYDALVRIVNLNDDQKLQIKAAARDTVERLNISKDFTHIKLAIG